MGVDGGVSSQSELAEPQQNVFVAICRAPGGRRRASTNIIPASIPEPPQWNHRAHGERRPNTTSRGWGVKEGGEGGGWRRNSTLVRRHYNTMDGPRRGKCCGRPALFAADTANLFIHLSEPKRFPGGTSHMISSSHEDQREWWGALGVRDGV